VNRKRLVTFVICAFALLLLVPAPGSAQDEREHFELRLGASYDEGDFGTNDTTKTIFVPLTFKYLGKRFDVGVTASWVQIETVGGVVVLDGTPIATGEGQRGRETESGIGDTLLKGRFYLVTDQGLPSPWPSINPFVKLKIPTGDEDKNLSTGEFDYGGGIEFDKTLGRVILFGDVSYTIIGEPPRQNFRNQPGASLGAGARVTNSVLLAALVDWRRAIVKGNEDPVQLIGILSFSALPTLTVSPYALVGLTSGASDFGVGFEVAYKFGRY
jgi:hypothetical protein